LGEKLQSLGWENEDVQLAMTQIVSRAIYPFSEYKTARILNQNSALCEVTGYPLEKLTKDKLYKSALRLSAIKDELEVHLSKKTNELFDIQDKILLYDLTNTYFEGEKRQSELAKYGRSKEKRNDAKIVVLAMVINPQGFIKYSSVFEGNLSDSQSIPKIIDQLRLRTSESQKATVVIDAGIASEENLKLILEKGYDYVCVSRQKIKDYSIDINHHPVKIKTQNKAELTLSKVISKNNTDYILKINSPGKALKESGMYNQFESRFLEQIKRIEQSLTQKNRVKKADKINQRIGRIIEKYPSVAQNYTLNVIQDKQGLATAIEYQKSTDLKQNHGEYFIKTSLEGKNEETVWNIYNTIREIESTFRSLKNDLDLRPIYHKTDEATIAHLHLGILGYWLVNTIRYQLKQFNINFDWNEIKRIAQTQKLVTTQGKNLENKIVEIRKSSIPSKEFKEILEKLNYKNYPFKIRKSVVHKPPLEKNETHSQLAFSDG
jgi:hypothetical protein